MPAFYSLKSLGAASNVACVGPIPEWIDVPCEPEEECLYVNVLYSPSLHDSALAAQLAVLSGATYRIIAEGHAASRNNDDEWTDADGTLIGNPSGVLDDPFLGQLYMALNAHEPGATSNLALSGAWTLIGVEGTIKATSGGQMLFAVADNTAAYGDNLGAYLLRIKRIA